MANYIKSVDFAAKDSLLTGDPLKIVSGTEIDDEYNAIQTAINSKANTNSPTLTGVPAAPTATAGTNTTQLATTAFVKTADDAIVASLGTMSSQDADSVNIDGGAIDGTVIGAGAAALITGTTITATTKFVGNLEGNVTGNVTGDLTGNADTATAANNALGEGQTVIAVTGSRSLGTTYTNNTGRTIVAWVHGSGSPSNGVIEGFIDGISIGRQGVQAVESAVMRATLTLIVPDGSTYRVNNVNGASLSSWTELR